MLNNCSLTLFLSLPLASPCNDNLDESLVDGTSVCVRTMISDTLWAIISVELITTYTLHLVEILVSLCPIAQSNNPNCKLAPQFCLPQFYFLILLATGNPLVHCHMYYYCKQ